MPSSIPVSARLLRGAAIPFLAACASCTSLIGGKAEIRENRKFIIESGQLELNLPNSERPYALHVEVGKFDISRLYDRNRIILRKSAEEVRDMAYHSWAVRPSEMITDAVEGYLKEARLFTDIRQDFVDVIPEYRITGTVKSLERLDSGDQWYANFRLSVQLVDGRNEVVKRWDFDDEAERVYHRDFVHTVSAFNELLRRFMYRVVRDMDHMFLIRKLQRENRPYQHILDVPNGRAAATADTAVSDTTRDAPHPDYDIIPGKGM